MQRTAIEAGDAAAWMLKCDPVQVYTVDGQGSPIWDDATNRPHDGTGGWSLAANYRAGVVAPGDRCFFWVSGDVTTGWPSGLWGECDIRDRATEGVGGGPWVDRHRMSKVVPYLPVEWRFLARPVPKKLVQSDPVMAKSELVVVPNRSNPVALTAVEVAALDNLIAGIASVPVITSRGKQRQGHKPI